MSEKESKDYFKKLMNDTQNKINDIDHNSNKLTSEPIEDHYQKKKSINEEAKIITPNFAASDVVNIVKLPILSCALLLLFNIIGYFIFKDFPNTDNFFKSIKLLQFFFL